MPSTSRDGALFAVGATQMYVSGCELHACMHDDHSTVMFFLCAPRREDER